MVRRLDSMTEQPLPGTEGADDPFWSPDGQSIAFFAQGKLKKVELSSGMVQTLCEARHAGRGTWNSKGVILFQLNSALYQVAADGGSPVPVTQIVQANQERAHAWPQFLPDGRHFLYTSIHWGGRDEAVFVGALDSKERKRVVDSHWVAAYSQSLDKREGYLLFVRDGNLTAQRFDTTRLQLIGQPVLLAERVADAAHEALFTSANGTLAYRSAALDKTQLTWFNRAGKQLGTVGLSMQDIHPAISPDGKRIAVVRGDAESGSSRANTAGPTEPSDIWVLDVERGAASRLTFDSSADHPVWSPDGNRIAFSSNRDGKLNIYQTAANGAGGEELLVKSNEDKIPTNFSRDGRFLVYSSISPQTGFDIWVLPLKGTRKPFPFLQTQFDEGVASFSPDEHWMAYQSTESGVWAIYVRPFGTLASEHLAPTGRWAISSEVSLWARWRGDGKELFYLHPNDRVMTVDVKMGISKGQPTFEVSSPKKLFDVRAYGLLSLAVTPDGQRFLVNTKSGEEKSPSVSVIVNWPALLKPPSK